MRGFVTWLHTPLSMRSWLLKFWFFGAVATSFVFCGVWEVVFGVKVLLGNNRPPLLHGTKIGIAIVFFFAVGGLSAWRAIRAYQRRRS